MHASRGPARPGEVSTAAPAVPVFFWSRAAPTPAPRRIQVIYTKRLENQGKTKQTKKRSQGATAKDVRAQSFGGTPSASGGVTLRGGNGPAGAGRAPAGAGAPAATGAANDARSVRPAPAAVASPAWRRPACPGRRSGSAATSPRGRPA